MVLPVAKGDGLNEKANNRMLSPVSRCVPLSGLEVPRSGIYPLSQKKPHFRKKLFLILSVILNPLHLSLTYVNSCVISVMQLFRWRFEIHLISTQALLVHLQAPA